MQVPDYTLMATYKTKYITMRRNLLKRFTPFDQFLASYQQNLINLRIENIS